MIEDVLPGVLERSGIIMQLCRSKLVGTRGPENAQKHDIVFLLRQLFMHAAIITTPHLS